MRAIRVVGLVVGALLAGCLGGVSCSGTGEAPYDAGSLLDASSGPDGGPFPDVSPQPADGSDAGDASLPPRADASLPPDDSGDSSVAHPTAGGAAALAGASDAASQAHDAGDASRADASDASPEP